MRIFFSVGEPSGDIHGANLIRALRSMRPDLDCVGFGGDRMEAAGCRLVYPLCQHAVMFIGSVLSHARTFLKLIGQADRYFREHRPDVVVLIDYPGFNWWIARRAKAHGIPVVYFVPPQLWAWAGWRVKKMRRLVDHVLCTLPFEEPWYRERGIEPHYVGHPFFDDLAQQRLDAQFLEQERRDPAPIIALLPGSRNAEIEHNWSMQYRAAVRIHRARPDVRFLVACFKEEQQQTIDAYLRRHAPLPLQTHLGRTPEIIELATACIAVSGSVSLELLWRGTPSVVVYRIKPIYRRLSRWFMKVPYISLVNLLAQRELFPEFMTDRCESARVADRILAWLNDPAALASVRQDLGALRDQVARPGACERASQFILAALASKHPAAA